MSESTLADETAIRSLIERWAVVRDAGMWDDFAELWCTDGRMSATWFEGSAMDFVAASRAGYEHGVNVTHFLGGCAIDIADGRAVAQTRVSITQRVELHGVPADIVCTGRYYDLLRRDEGRWGILDRNVIYENDRIVLVVPGASIPIDHELLAQFPEGYRHLAYAQTIAGMQVRRELPGRTGPAVEALLQRGREWLGGADAVASNSADA